MHNVMTTPYLKYCASSVELAIDWANAIRIVPGFEGHSGQAMPPLCVFVCLCVCVCMCVCDRFSWQDTRCDHCLDLGCY